MQPVLLFDGVCNLCHFWVKFIVKHNQHKNIRFASLQSEKGKALIHKYLPKESIVDSVVFIQEEKAYTKSNAAFMICKQLDGAWRLLSIFSFLPTALSDTVYDWVAAHRYKWFGKQDECLVPNNELKERFL